MIAEFRHNFCTFAHEMQQQQRTYIAIDLKSFYASVECVDRGLDPLTTNLVVADESRTEKTICLAVSPSLKAYGIGGRARLFEVLTSRKVPRPRSATNRLEDTRHDPLLRRYHPSPPSRLEAPPADVHVEPCRPVCTLLRIDGLRRKY